MIPDVVHLLWLSWVEVEVVVVDAATCGLCWPLWAYIHCSWLYDMIPDVVRLLWLSWVEVEVVVVVD